MYICQHILKKLRQKRNLLRQGTCIKTSHGRQIKLLLAVHNSFRTDVPFHWTATTGV